LEKSSYILYIHKYGIFSRFLERKKLLFIVA